MAPLFGAIASDGSSHITSSSVYSPYPPPLQPLRSSRARQPIARPTVFENIRHSIHSLFSANASTIDASTPPPLPQFTPKLQRLSVNTARWQLPGFGPTNDQDAPALSANFAHGEPLYKPHPVVNYPSSAADQSPGLDETQRSPANYRPLTPRTLAELQQQTSQAHRHGVRTPPAVYEFRRQSRLYMREMLSEAGSNERVRQQPEGHRRQFSGVDREELILCHEIDRRQREKREKKRKNSAASGQSTKKKSSSKKKSSKKNEKMWNGRYRPCLSSSNKRLRGKSIACFVSGGLLMAMVSTYLGLALSPHPLNSTGHILLILAIAAMTLVFCLFLLSVARLAFTTPHPKSHKHATRQHGHHHRQHQRDLARDLEMQDENGYAVPAQPVPITFAETAQISYYAPDYNAPHSRQGTPDKVIPPPPPAYGIWRESVRVDPSRIYWARNPNVTPAMESAVTLRAQHTDTRALLEGRDAVGGVGERLVVRRPPSYASDVSPLSEDEHEHQGSPEQGRLRETWGRERDVQEMDEEEREVEMMFVHPRLRR